LQDGIVPIRSREKIMQKPFQAALMVSAATLSMALATIPAAAVSIMPGDTLLPPDAFGPISATQGTLQASTTFVGSALTFSAIFRQAVYLNTLGTLDFYYQVVQTGPGSIGENQEIKSFTVADFQGFTVDGFAAAGDPDGAGIFASAFNPPSSTTTFGRSGPIGRVVQTDFGGNGLVQGETSATYIFRTNATAFDFRGTFGIIDGSTVSGLTYQPIVAAAVPEPAMWAMMVLGFGAVGSTMRRRSAARSISA